MKLNQLKIGQSAVITAVGGEGALRNRLIDMGISPEALYDSWKHFESEMRFSSPFFVAPRERRECNVQVRRATGFVVVEDDH